MNIRSYKRYSLFLYSGFSILLIGFIFLSFFYFKQILLSNEVLSETTTNNNIQQRSAMKMRVAVRERAILLWHMTYQEDVFDRDDSYQKFNELGAHFLRAHEEYITTKLTKLERNLLLELNKETKKRSLELRHFAEMLMIDEEIENHLHQLDNALTEQIIVSSILDEIIQLQSTQNENAHRQSVAITDNNISDLIIWMLVFIFAVFLFAKRVVEIANRQSKKLTEVNKELRKLARNDYLTQLPNRLFLLEHLELTLAHAKRHGKNGALLFIDIDEFKPINDTYGHNVGDAYLQAISLAVKKQLRTSDLLVRLGGDEFIVVLYEITSEEDALIVTKKLLKTLSSEYSIDDAIVSASASIGICLFPQENMGINSLLREADKAMYQAKKAGKNGYYI